MDQAYNFDQILESAVVASWVDLMGRAAKGSVHVEYDVTSSGALDHLQVWSSTARGCWLLACEYQRTDSDCPDTRVHFYNGYQSEGLARILGLVVLHQKMFTLPERLGRAGLLQIAPPTEGESAMATVSLSEALDRVSSASAEPVLA